MKVMYSILGKRSMLVILVDFYGIENQLIEKLTYYEICKCKSVHLNIGPIIGFSDSKR